MRNFKDHSTFNGTIAIQPSNTGCGIEGFLEEWKKDAASAVMWHHMGDRDSYPGHYLANLIDNGIILREELERACRLALEAWASLPENEKYSKESYWMLGFEEILAAACIMRLTSVQNWFVEHFNEQWVRPDQWEHDSWKVHLINVTWSAPEAHKLKAWALRQIRNPKWEMEMGLLSLAYFNQGEMKWDTGVESHLTKLTKKARRLLKSGTPLIRSSSGSFIDSPHCLREIQFMLLGRFQAVIPAGKDEAGRHARFATALKRTEKWLRAQNAYVPIPV